MVLSGVRMLLRRLKDLKIVAEATDSTTTLLELERASPDVLILDLWMGGEDSVSLLRQIHARWPLVRILVYSINDEQAFGMRAFRLGASGYLMKTRGLEELVKALRIVATGGHYMSPELSRTMVELVSRSKTDAVPPPSIATLSDRELQIMHYIGRGQTPAAIARKLHISVRTVGAHRENLKNKLGLADGGALMRKAVLLVANQGLK